MYKIIAVSKTLMLSEVLKDIFLNVDDPGEIFDAWCNFISGLNECFEVYPEMDPEPIHSALWHLTQTDCLDTVPELPEKFDLIHRYIRRFLEKRPIKDLKHVPWALAVMKADNRDWGRYSKIKAWFREHIGPLIGTEDEEEALCTLLEKVLAPYTHDNAIAQRVAITCIDPFARYEREIKVDHPGDANLKEQVLNQRQKSMQPGDKVPRVFDTIWSGSTLPDKYVKNLSNLICDYFSDGFTFYIWTDQDFSKNSPMGRQVNTLINLVSGILGVSQQDVQEQVKCYNYYDVLNVDPIVVENDIRDILLTAEVGDKHKTIPFFGSDLLRVLINAECRGGIYIDLDLLRGLNRNTTNISFTKLIREYTSGMHGHDGTNLTDAFFYSPGNRQVVSHCYHMAMGLSKPPTEVRHICPSYGWSPKIRNGTVNAAIARAESYIAARVNSRGESYDAGLFATESSFHIPYCSDEEYIKQFNRVSMGKHTVSNSVERAVSEIVHELIMSPFFPNLADIQALEGNDIMCRALRIVKQKRPDLLENVVAPIIDDKGFIIWNKIDRSDKNELFGHFSQELTYAIDVLKDDPEMKSNTTFNEEKTVIDLKKLSQKDDFEYDFFIAALIKLIENMVFTYHLKNKRTGFKDTTFDDCLLKIIAVLKECAIVYPQKCVDCVDIMKTYMDPTMSDKVRKGLNTFKTNYQSNKNNL